MNLVSHNLTLDEIGFVVNSVVAKLGGKKEARRFICEKVILGSVKIGTGLNADGFRMALRRKGFRISDRANEMLGNLAFTVASEGTEVDLIDISVGELGCTGGARYKEICLRGLERGFRLCPAEVAPQTCLQIGQSINGPLRFAMEAIADSNGDPGIFMIDRDGHDLWLGHDRGGDNDFHFPGRRFAFELPRK